MAPRVGSGSVEAGVRVGVRDGAWVGVRTIVLVTLTLAVLAGCVTPPNYGGPLQARNQHPAQLTVLRLEPAPATTLAKGRARAG